jgi:hypothetical protein
MGAGHIPMALTGVTVGPILISCLRTYHIIRMPQLSVFSHTSGAEVRGQYKQGSLNGRTFSIWWMQAVFCLWARMFLLI